MSKAEKLSKFLMNGGSGTQHELAMVVGTTNNGIRSFVSSLRNAGVPIAQRRVRNKSCKEYYIPFANKAKRTIAVEQIINGVHFRGKLVEV